MTAPHSQSPSLPVVVHLGFAGSRQLFDPRTSAAEQAALHDSVRDLLAARLTKLRDDLGFTPQHFLCGVSQVAIGADTLFTEVCQSMALPQRVFLPQPREDYLTAEGSTGPDFTTEQRATARKLLDSPHVIEERVVSHAADRHSRFEEVNLEIARVSDVILCLVRPDADARSGGTLDLLATAARRGKPVLEVRVAFENGNAVLTEQWHGLDPDRGGKPFVLPLLPAEVADAQAPERATEAPASGVPMSALTYLGALKTVGSGQAELRRRTFKTRALLIIAAHVLATVCAVLALTAHDHPALPWLLGGELILLAAGLFVHVLLHHSRAVRVWAMSRLVAEVARSVKSLRHLHVPLDYLFSLPYPPVMQPLLRTIDVLHLSSTRRNDTPLKEKCRAYVVERLEGERGQIAYYKRSLSKAQGLRRWASRFFYIFTTTAFAAALLKLLLVRHCLPLDPSSEPLWAPVFGALAILMPVLAVSMLSLAASFDLEARVHTYQDTLSYLETTKPLFEGVRSERELTRLVLETEMQLLGETANWASRRSFTSVT